jgi:hypothetical protein
MPYLGNTPTTQSFISGTDYFNGTGAQTAFTLSRTVASVNDIQAVVNNVVQVPNDAYTISGTTITFTSAPSSGTQNVYVRYLSTTTQAITPSQGTVSWSTLDSNVQGDLGISFKNRIINSNMAIDQRNAGASVTPTSPTYITDRWQAYNNSGSGRYTIVQSSTAATGFTNSLLVTSTGAYSVGAGDILVIRQAIEGYNIADLGYGTANAKTITLSFWVRSSLTGTFGGSFSNDGANRNYAYTYTINSANTWEQKTVTITGDTTGTWLGTNGTGLNVWFQLGVGSTYTTSTTGSWISTANIYGVTGATSVVGTNGATWYITGVQLEVGTQATTFTTAGGSYGAELQLCQRYYCKTYNISVVPGTADGSGSIGGSGTGNLYRPIVNWSYPVQMRATPTITLYSPSTGASGKVRDDNTGADLDATAYRTGTSGTRWYPTSTPTSGNDIFGQVVASIEL